MTKIVNSSTSSKIQKKVKPSAKSKIQKKMKHLGKQQKMADQETVFSRSIAKNDEQNVDFSIISKNFRRLDEEEEKQMWKLFKGKTVLMFRLCSGCQYKLFHSVEKWSKFKEGVDIKFHLCPRCVRVNCWMTNLMAPAMPKKFVQKLENDGEEK
jgi:hypothetical protein